MIEIKEGAVFIADAHYPHHGDEFMAVLQKIESGDLLASQLFLMGDIFDLLFGHNKYIHTINNVVITLLNKLSRKVEIYYFEGNHDFCLANIFPNIKVYTREEQPIYMSMGNQKIGLSHGDKFDGGFCYDSYCLLLRNKFTLNMLKPFQKHIIDYRIKKLSEKNICHGFINFEAKVGRIMTNYNDVNLVIEGHFHQAKQFGKYISLPSLACQKQIAVVQNNQISYFDMV
jgi:UDP-2,3-diacylglucosamine hydrolase